MHLIASSAGVPRHSVRPRTRRHPTNLDGRCPGERPCIILAYSMLQSATTFCHRGRRGRHVGRAFFPIRVPGRCSSRKPNSWVGHRRCRRDRSGYRTRVTHPAESSDSAANVEKYLQQMIGNRADASLRAAFLKAGPEAVDVLENDFEVKLRAYARHPDYRSELEGAAVAGRALEPLPFDGRLLGDAPACSSAACGVHVAWRDDGRPNRYRLICCRRRHRPSRCCIREAVDATCARQNKLPRGSRLVMGNALVGRLLYSLIRRDVDILTGTSLEKLSAMSTAG